MKKISLILFAAGIGFYSFGQKATKMANTNKNVNASALMADPFNGEETPSGPINYSNPTTRNNRIGLELIVGKTKYDSQSNRSTTQRIKMLTNGKISAVWTWANSGTPFNDRGSFYNLMTGGGVWSPYPVGTPITSMQRIEAAKTGWPSHAVTNNEGSELLVAHYGTNLASIYKRTTLGTGNWSEVANTLPMVWPRVVTSGTDNNTVHIIACHAPSSPAFRFKGIYCPLIYSKSTDGGTNWTTRDLLPGYDSTMMKKTMGEDYAIDARGNTVAIVLGGYFNDTYLFKSTDNGANWSKKLIYHFPYAPFNPDSVLAVPTTDTVPCFDGSFSIVIDNSNNVHIWGGVTRFLQTALAATSYFPGQTGMIYWREDMPTITGDLKLCTNFCWPWNYYVERNGNTTWDCMVGGWNKMGFNVGATSMPCGSIDADGKLYVVFMHPSDADKSTFHIYAPDTVPYRHLFSLSSTDNGATWSDAFEITPFDEGRDYIFPSVVKNTTDSLRVLYQEDDLPGHSLNPSTGNPHPSGYECDIVYLAVPIADLVSTPNKNKETVKVTLYPNPANEYTNITFTLAKAGNINLSVINIMGQKVASYRIDGISGKNYKQLNTETLASGIYVVKIEAEGKVYTEKLIVN